MSETLEFDSLGMMAGFSDYVGISTGSSSSNMTFGDLQRLSLFGC